MEKEIIVTEGAPAAIGHYSQAIRIGNLIFTAGQAALDPETNQLIIGGATEQAEQVMKNLQVILESAGSSLNEVIKTTIFLRFIKDFGEVNEVYASFMGENKPARSTVAVSSLPMQALVEIEMVASSHETLKETDTAIEDESLAMGEKKKGKKKKKDKAKRKK